MKSRPGSILIVDDEEKWQKTLVNALRQNDYIAEAVANVAQALEKLSTADYHIVVLDIRFPNTAEDSDPSKAPNQRGLDLLEELDRRGLKETTKVIMLSGYGTLKTMRQAFKDYEVADFLSKDDFDPQTFLESVKQVFTQKVRINQALNIQWQQIRRSEDIILNLEVNGRRIGPGSALRRQLFDELEDLLCRLFYKAEMILARPLTPGWSGEKVLLIQPFIHGKGRGNDVIVKFGDAKKSRREHDNFHEFVEDLLRGARRTTILDQRYTLHLGGTVYSFLGTGNDQFVDFAHFYHHTNDTSKITDVLSRLFRETCGNWYDNRLQTQPLDLAADYRRFFNYSPKQLEQIVATHLPFISAKGQLTTTSLNLPRKFTNPLLVATKFSLICFTSTCIMHGDFNPYNLFVDQAGFTWLIDFQTTERGHILRDFAMLDSAIRFQLLTAQDATLEERLLMEDILCTAKQFGEVRQLEAEFTTNNQTLAKAYATILHLRTLAGSIVAQYPYIDINEYYVALFYNALNTLQFSSLEPVQREHALLSASLLADKLGLGSSQQR